MSGATTAISAAMAAAGTGLGMYANNQQLRSQDRTAAAGLMAQRGLRDQANQDVQKTIQTSATNNDANIARNRATQQQAYAAALNRASPVQSGAVTSVPGASKRYAADVTAARGNVADYGNKLAANTAAIDAPQLTNMQTQLNMGDTATKLGLLNDTSNNQNELTKMSVGAIKANPWLLATGSALQGAGQGYAARNYGVKKPAVEVGTGDAAFA